MAIQGVYLEPIRLNSDMFKEFEKRFNNKLIAMYEINFAEVVNGYLGPQKEWDDASYYHGTAHCGCLDQRIVNPENDRVPVYAWCRNARCATRGIINSGFRKTKSPRGHFFSPQVEDARRYATHKGRQTASTSPLLSIFVSVIKKGSRANETTNTVQNDNEILPVYIAIVRK
ncbi:hypothetical protein BGW39_004865 [Mortierella sp. 14UC]|nr:hypothetical protein BGW39_004865 [Mortierella sp. 14UC]